MNLLMEEYKLLENDIIEIFKRKDNFIFDKYSINPFILTD